MAAVTLPDGQRTLPVRLLPSHASAILAFLDRAVLEPPRKRRNMWPIVLRLMERDGCISSRTLATEAGGSQSSACWYLGRMARTGKLRRTAPRRYEVVP
jgi:hypothetical protein